jgi:hypothetical protein
MVRAGEFSYILTPRQMGKTSLVARTSVQLALEGMKCVVIDLSGMGTSDQTPESWYLGQIKRIVVQLRLSEVDYAAWWLARGYLGIVQRFIDFLNDVVLAQVQGPVVIFVDEIDTTLSLPFSSDDYFAAIRSLYNERATSPALERLSFVLLGVASPTDLIRDSKRTPFNIGRRIVLSDFTAPEAEPLLAGLAPDPEIAVRFLDQIIFWTGGHPYLTQKACSAVAEWGENSWDTERAAYIVDRLIRDLFLSESGRNTDANLQFVKSRILEVPESAKLLEIFRAVRRGETVSDDELDPTLSALKLSGLVKPVDGLLKVRNPIYERAFDEHWIVEALAEPTPRPAARSASSYDVFLSCDRREQAWTEDILIEPLEGAGLKVFADFRDIPVGQSYLASIDEAINRSRHALVVLTPGFLASRWVEIETFFVGSRGVSDSPGGLIPILLRRTRLPKRLDMIRAVDLASGGRPGRELQRLFDHLGVPVSVDESERRLKSFRPSSIDSYDSARVHEMLSGLRKDDVDFLYRQLVGAGLLDRILGRTKQQMIDSLVDSAQKKGFFEQLLDLVAQSQPELYRNYFR